MIKGVCIYAGDFFHSFRLLLRFEGSSLFPRINKFGGSIILWVQEFLPEPFWEFDVLVGRGLLILIIEFGIAMVIHLVVLTYNKNIIIGWLKL